jgi:hypothetical protein
MSTQWEEEKHHESREIIEATAAREPAVEHATKPIDPQSLRPANRRMGLMLEHPASLGFRQRNHA